MMEHKKEDVMREINESLIVAVGLLKQSASTCGFDLNDQNADKEFDGVLTMKRLILAVSLMAEFMGIDDEKITNGLRLSRKIARLYIEDNPHAAAEMATKH